MEKINIAVVDDHSLFREGVISTLQLLNLPLEMFQAANGNEFIKLLETTTIDVVLMDINMPGLNGVDASRIALQMKPDLKIIALTMQLEEDYFEDMLTSGVKGFLTKTIDKDDLEQAINFVLKGKQYFSEDVLPLFMHKLANKKDSAPKVKLSDRELEVLQLIAEGLTNQEIGEKIFISSRTVANHRTNLLTKTDTKNTAALITYAVKNKLLK